MMKIDNEIADPLLELNLKVAAIAGWGNIQEWNPNPKTRKPKRTLSSLGYASCGIFDAYATNPPSPAIALCKLLLELAPDLDDELCQKGYEQAVAETQPELERGDFATIAEIEIAREILKPTEQAAKALKALGL